MRKRDAVKLHNGDEVVVKETSDVTEVLDVYTDEAGNVLIDTTYDGFTTFMANEIK